MDGSEARPRLQASAVDYAAVAASLLSDRPRSLPRQRFYRLLNQENAGDKQGHLMAGVAVDDGARRRLPPGAEPAADALKAYRTRRNLETLAANLNDPGKTLAQIGPLLAGLPEDQGAAAALSIGNLYARQGQWPLARETFLLMVDRYPAHPLSAQAYRWLIRHISSSEARRRHELEQFLMIQRASVFHNPPDPEEKKRTPPEGGVVQQTRLTYLTDKAEARQWYRGSLEFGKRLAGYGPLFASDPSTLFCLQASRRNLGEFEEARGWYQKLRTHFGQGPWHDAAAAELWLDRRQGPPPKPAVLCQRAETRPYLDGNLDEPCWQGKPLVLGDAVNKTAADYRTEAWFAYDKDHLYIALRCKHPAGQRVPPVKKRKHDDDLRRFDRVSIMLDLDRDYATYFHLQIDQRGCLHEDCWGDAGWNPRWFVAVNSTDDCWQIEAAIPLTELTADRIRGGTAWAANVVRILPGRGVQAFSLPADLEPRPEGMGLLLFDSWK
jgi:tetratricopeptide (TPR) repeat protein